MYRLVAPEGLRWATVYNEYIFNYPIWLMDKKEALKYHLIDEEGNFYKDMQPIENYIEEFKPGE